MATNKRGENSNDFDGEFFGYEFRAFLEICDVSPELAAEVRFCVDSAEPVLIEVGSVQALLIDIATQTVT
jgi:hypothetical protein